MNKLGIQYLRFEGVLRFAILGTAKRKTASKRKTMLGVYVLRDPGFTFLVLCGKIIITICVNLSCFALFLRFGKCYVLRPYIFPRGILVDMMYN